MHQCIVNQYVLISAFASSRLSVFPKQKSRRVAGLCKTCFLGNFFRFSVLDVLGFQGLEKNGFVWRTNWTLDFAGCAFTASAWFFFGSRILGFPGVPSLNWFGLLDFAGCAFTESAWFSFGSRTLGFPGVPSLNWFGLLDLPSFSAGGAGCAFTESAWFFWIWFFWSS